MEHSINNICIYIKVYQSFSKSEVRSIIFACVEISIDSSQKKKKAEHKSFCCNLITQRWIRIQKHNKRRADDVAVLHHQTIPRHNSCPWAKNTASEL